MKTRLLLLASLAISVLCLPTLSQSRGEGIGLFQQGKAQEAAGVLSSVVKTNKKDKVAWMFLGAALNRTHRQKEAVKAFRNGDLKFNEKVTDYDRQLDVLSMPRGSYTEEARRNVVKGVVTLAVEFLADGTIGSVVPVDTLPDGLTENCISAAKLIKFKPAEIRGKPVTTVATVEYKFDLL